MLSNTKSTPTSIYWEYNLWSEFRGRFVVIIFYIFAAFSNTLLYSTFTPFATRISEIYGISSFEVNLASLIFMLFHPIFSFLANFTLDAYGIKVGLNLGLVFTIVGAGVRIFINRSFWFVLLGQTLAACANPFITNAPAKIASNWFFPQNRATITTILSLALSLGGAVSIGLPSLLIDLSELTDEEAKSQLYYLLYLEAIIVATFAFPNFLMFRDHPPTPPSFTATVKKENFLRALKIISTHKNYLLLLFSTGLLLGSFNSIVVVISYITTPFITTSETTAYLAFSLVTGGAIGAGFWNIYLKRTHHYKKTLVVNGAMAIAGLGAFIGLLYTDNIWFLTISTFIMGFSLCSFFPLSLEYGCELIFPIGEGSAAGFLLASIHFFGLVQGIIASFLTDGTSQETSLEASLYFLLSFLVANILLLFNHEELKRTEVEAQNESAHSPLTAQSKIATPNEAGGYLCSGNMGQNENREDFEEKEKLLN